MDRLVTQRTGSNRRPRPPRKSTTASADLSLMLEDSLQRSGTGLLHRSSIELGKNTGHVSAFVPSGATTIRKFQSEVALRAIDVITKLNKPIHTVTMKQGVTSVPLNFLGHDLCQAYEGRGTAWVFAPVVDVFGVFSGSVFSKSLQITFSPDVRCTPRPQCDTIRLYKSLTWEKAGARIDVSIIFESNDFPHLTPAGQAAVADIIQQRLTTL